MIFFKADITEQITYHTNLNLWILWLKILISNCAKVKQATMLKSFWNVAGYGELVATLQRLQLNLKKNGLNAGHGYSSLEVQIGAVQTLLLSPEFGRALAIHNKVQQSWPQQKNIQPITAHSQILVRDVSNN